MEELGGQLVWWVTALVLLAAAVVWALTAAVVWALDRVAGWLHRRRGERLE